MAYVNLTLPQFQSRFSSENSCLDAIFATRWPHGFICPHCKHNDGTRLPSRPRIVQCSNCRRQTSITANTLFHRSHLPLTKWFLAIYLIAHDKGGASARRLENQLGISYPTAWFLLQRIHAAMASRDKSLTLAGFIELDEAFFGGKSKSKRQRKPPSDNKKQILVMVESEGRKAGNLVMRVIPGNQLEDLKPVIAEKVDADPGGHWFRSDGWGTHHVVMQLGHRISMNVVPAEKQDEILRCVNLAVSHAKRFFKGTFHQFCKTHIQRYLDGFTYRWNRRHLGKQLASHLVAACALCDWAPYKSLIQSKPIPG